MKYILGLCVFIISCQPKTKTVQEFADSLNFESRKDSFVTAKMDEIYKRIYFDTVGVSEAPVKVLNSRLIKESYSSSRSIQLTYKNISNKRVEAIRFKWYGENAFGEAADMGTSLQQGFGSGIDNDALGAGKTRTSQWSIYSSDGKKIIKAWAYNVAFSDGSQWESKSNK